MYVCVLVTVDGNVNWKGIDSTKILFTYVFGDCSVFCM